MKLQKKSLLCLKVFLSLFAIFFLMVPLALAEIVVPPAPDTYVLDEANVLSEETENKLNAELATLEQETSTQMVVVTVPSLQGYEPEQFALAIGRSWGVGQKEFNNGLVFLIAPTEREVRIEVGYGLEGAIPDAIAWEVVDKIATPYLSVDNYDQGTLESISALEAYARGETFDMSKYGSDLSDSLQGIFIIVFFLMFFVFRLLSFLSYSKSWWFGGLLGAIVGGIISPTLLVGGIGALIGLFLDFLVSKPLYGFFRGADGHGGFFGRFGGKGGSGGGGFGGFSGGGGGFGGGGAGGHF